MRKITLQDIARELGVTKGTVDRAIHNRKGINPATRQRVLELAQKYEYKADKAAKSLSLKAKYIKLGVILQTEPDFFWANIKNGVKAAEEELIDYGIEVVYKGVRNRRQGDEILSSVEELLDERVNGIILVPSNSSELRLKIDEISDAGIPVVTLNDDIEGSRRLFYVGPQIRQSGRMAGELVSRFLGGKKSKVLVINSCGESFEYSERLEGFSEVMAETKSSTEIITLRDMCSSSFAELASGLSGIEAIYVINGAMLHPIGEFISNSEALRGKVLVGHEISEKVTELIKCNVVHACVSQDPFSQGYFASKLMHHYMMFGEKPQSERLYTRLDIIMKENLILQNNIINPNYMKL